MNATAIYFGSNGEDTCALYRHLETLGPAGVVAVNLFRAQKASARAKVYRGRGYRAASYDKKAWSLGNLCQALADHGAALGIVAWGWKEDPAQAYHRWVFYADLPTGQISFHAERPLCEQRYAGEWDGCGKSAERIIRHVQALLDVVAIKPQDESAVAAS